mmetsp:Transcript_24247/g.56311  ORF Transcript_24247/g.56311 Transcript_24247/m.56311 type:complete len:230 (+) Transcript_24247:419-1108(+)
MLDGVADVPPMLLRGVREQADGACCFLDAGIAFVNDARCEPRPQGAFGRMAPPALARSKSLARAALSDDRAKDARKLDKTSWLRWPPPGVSVVRLLALVHMGTNSGDPARRIRSAARASTGLGEALRDCARMSLPCDGASPGDSLRNRCTEFLLPLPLLRPLRLEEPEPLRGECIADRLRDCVPEDSRSAHARRTASTSRNRGRIRLPSAGVLKSKNAGCTELTLQASF